MLTPRRAEGREFEPRPGHYSRMSFFIRPGSWHGFPAYEYAFPFKFKIYLEHCPRGEAELTVDLDFPLLVLEVASHVKKTAIPAHKF